MELKRPAGDVVVRPVPEHRADEELSALYRDLKTTLGVPWVGVVTQAFAHYRPFFVEAWRQFRPTAASAYFGGAGEELRQLAGREMSSAFDIPSQRPALEAAGYSDREMAQIAGTLDLFDQGNPKYLLLATVIRASLAEGRSLGGNRARTGAQSEAAGKTASPVGATPVMIEEHHAFGDLRHLYGDMKAALELPFINSDYKAMARWPSYLRLAWESLQPRLHEPAYMEARVRLHTRAVDLLDELPYPYALDKETAVRLGHAAADVEPLTRTAELFQWLLSGLMLNVSYFRLALRDER